MRQINILAVDDQISSLIALEDILQGIDARLIKSSSAKEALLIMLKEPIDCILLDVSMPGMDGFEFLKTLHQAPAHASIPVLMITGKIFSENETIRAYKYGAVDFLLKPLKPETVYRKVSFIVQQARRINVINEMGSQFKQFEQDLIQPLEHIITADKIGTAGAEQLSDVIVKLKGINKMWGDLSND